MISLNQLKKTRSSVAALSTLIALQSLYAQSADAQVTFTSTIPDQRIRQQDIAAKLYPVWIE